MNYPIPVREAVEILSTQYRCLYNDALDINCTNAKCSVYNNNPKRCVVCLDKNRVLAAYSMAMHALRMQQINDNIEGK